MIIRDLIECQNTLLDSIRNIHLLNRKKEQQKVDYLLDMLGAMTINRESMTLLPWMEETPKGILAQLIWFLKNRENLFAPLSFRERLLSNTIKKDKLWEQLGEKDANIR